MDMDIKDMALFAIEFLSTTEGCADDVIGTIYSIAHAANGQCQPHEDWIELTKKVFAEAALQGYHPRTKEDIDRLAVKAGMGIRIHQQPAATEAGQG